METLSKLAPGDPEEDQFEIRYAVLPALSSPAGDVKVILRQRQRTSKPHYELTYKIRSSSLLPAEPSLAIGHCPAGAGADSPGDEVDVAFTGATEPVRVHSRSCTVESKTAAPAVPEALNAKFAPCLSRMTRLKRNGLKVEEWHLPGGRVAIEVSKSGPDTAAELEAFQRDVVDPLVLIHKVRPLQESKTEMGSDCGA